MAKVVLGPCMAATVGPLDHLWHHKWSSFATDVPPCNSHLGDPKALHIRHVIAKSLVVAS